MKTVKTFLSDSIFPTPLDCIHYYLYNRTRKKGNDTLKKDVKRWIAPQNLISLLRLAFCSWLVLLLHTWQKTITKKNKKTLWIRKKRTRSQSIKVKDGNKNEQKGSKLFNSFVKENLQIFKWFWHEKRKRREKIVLKT